MYTNSIGGDILWSRRSSLSYFIQKKLKNCWQSSSVMIQYNQSKGKGSEQNEEKAE